MKVAWNRTMSLCAGHQGETWYVDGEDTIKGHTDLSPSGFYATHVRVKVKNSAVSAGGTDMD